MSAKKDATISPENKAIARYTAAAFGGTPRVSEYADRTEQTTVGILYCRDRPQEGVTAYSTIGLSDHPMKWGDGEFPTRLELVGVCANTAENFPNILASAAFSIMRNDYVYHPGTVMPDFFSESLPASELRHLYLATPFLWQNELITLDCGTKKVSWLLAMAISDPEYLYLKEHGEQAFERLLEERRVDVSDLERLSEV